MFFSYMSLFKIYLNLRYLYLSCYKNKPSALELFCNIYSIDYNDSYYNRMIK